MRFSARSFSLSRSSRRSSASRAGSAPARARALHRLRRDDAVGVDVQELLGRRAEQGDVAEPHVAAVMARARPAQREVRRGGIGVHVDVDAIREAQLVGVAAHDRGLAAVDELGVPPRVVPPTRRRRCGGHRRARDGRPALHGCRGHMLQRRGELIRPALPLVAARSRRREPHEAHGARAVVEHDGSVDEEERGIRGLGRGGRHLVRARRRARTRTSRTSRAVRRRRGPALRRRRLASAATSTRPGGSRSASTSKTVPTIVDSEASAPSGVDRVTVPRATSAVTSSLASWAAAMTLTPVVASVPPSSHTANAASAYLAAKTASGSRHPSTRRERMRRGILSA